MATCIEYAINLPTALAGKSEGSILSQMVQMQFATRWPDENSQQEYNSPFKQMQLSQVSQRSRYQTELKTVGKHNLGCKLVSAGYKFSNVRRNYMGEPFSVHVTMAGHQC